MKTARRSSGVRALFAAPLIRGLLVLNLILATGWIFVSLNQARGHGSEAKRQEARDAFVRIGGYTEAEAREMQNLGDRTRRDTTASDADVAKLLDEIEQTRPAAGRPFTDSAQRIRYLLTLGRIKEVRAFTRAQERLIAERLPPIPRMGDPSLEEPFQELARSVAARIQDPVARRTLEAAIKNAR